MTPYVKQFVPDEEERLLYTIKRSITALPDIDLGRDEEAKSVVLSCHILARAVAKVFKLKYVDGYFYPNFEHSWLLTPNGHIIDVYPVAILGGPLLMDGSRHSPASRYYIKCARQKFSRGRFGKVSFRRSVRRITNELVRISSTGA
jgi:hypothetical protein